MESTVSEKKPKPYSAIPHESFIHRGKPQTILENYFNKKSQNQLPIIAIGGLPGSGATSLAIHIAENNGKIIWVNIEEGKQLEEIDIIESIGNYLEDFYNDNRISQAIQENNKNNVPNTVRLILIDELFNSLLKDKYVLVFNNFQNRKKQPALHEFLSRIGVHLGNRKTLFRGVILVTLEEHPKIKDVHICHEVLGGFSKYSDTKKITELYNVELSDELLKLIHQQTDGYPGYIKLMFSLIELYGDLSFELIRSHFARPTKLPKVREKILSLIDDRLSEKQRTVLKYISLLEHPFNFRAAAEILRSLMKNNFRETILSLEQIYILSTSPDGNFFYSPIYIRDYFSELLDDKDKYDFNESAAKFYADERKYLQAAEFHITIKQYDKAAELLLEPMNKDDLVNESITKYLMLLDSIKNVTFSKPENKTLVNMRIGDIYEILADYEQALNTYEKIVGDLKDQSHIQIAILRKIGWTNIRLCKWDRAKKAYYRALEIIAGDTESRKIDEHLRKIEEARISTQLGYIQFLKSEHNEAIAIFEQVEPKFDEVVNAYPILAKEFQAQALQFLGLAYVARCSGDDLSKALSSYERALTLSKEIHDHYGALQTELQIGILKNKTGEYPIANRLFSEVYRGARRLHSVKLRADYFRRKGSFCCEQGEYRHGEKYLRMAIDILTKIHDLHGLAWAHNALAILYFEVGKYSFAKQQWERASEIFGSIDTLNDKSGIEGNLAIIEYHKGNFKEAEERWKECRKQVRKLPAIEWQFSTEFFLTKLSLLKAANDQTTKQQLKQAETCANSPESKIYFSLLQGEFFLCRGQCKDALNSLQFCCSDNAKLVFEANMECKLLQIEILLLMNERKAAESIYQEISEFVGKTNSLLVEAGIKRALTMLEVENGNYFHLFRDCIELYSQIPSELEVAETKFRVGRMMKKFNLSQGDSLLQSARLFYNNNWARSRRDEIDHLLRGDAKFC